MLKRIKRGLIRGLDGIGATQALARSAWRQSRLLILCYHSVSLADEHEWSPALSVSPDFLEARLRALRHAGASVLPLDEAVARLRTGTLPPRSVVLTFDDGFHDFHAAALPLLRQYDMPATVYLTTFYVERPAPIFNVFLSYLLWKGRTRGVLSAMSLLGVVGEEAWDLELPEDRVRAHAAVMRHADRLGLDAGERDALCDRVARAVGVDPAPLRARRILSLMAPDEVRAAAAAGMDVQLHTHRHRLPRERALFLQEIDDNRRVIDGMIEGSAPSHFCYPSGAYSPVFVPWLRERGVESATTCFSGLAARGSDLLRLPRVMDGPQLSPCEFAAWVAGVADLLPHRRVAHPVGVPAHGG